MKVDNIVKESFLSSIRLWNFNEIFNDVNQDNIESHKKTGIHYRFTRYI